MPTDKKRNAAPVRALALEWRTMTAASPTPRPRLMLVTAALDRASGTDTALAEAIAAADIAAVIVRLAAVAERDQINVVKALAKTVQDNGAALLLDEHAKLAARAGADGAHLTGIDAFNAAAPALKPDRIAGAGGLHSRHDAMTAAEGGADYVLFGEPDTEGHRPALESIVERVGWWAEVFQTPCVGYAATAGDIEPLARAGADFVALDPAIWTKTPRAAVLDAAGKLAVREPAT